MDAFRQHTARVGRITGSEAFDVTVRRCDAMTVVGCLREMHIVCVPDVTPFVVQAAITRVGCRTETAG